MDVWDKSTSELIEESSHFIYAYEMVELGRRYFHGIGVETNYNEAIKWFTEATTTLENESHLGEYWLGLCYYEGKGVAQDKKRAFEYFKTASYGWKAEEANVMLGDCYYNGEGTAKDLGMAFDCFEKSAKSGNKVAIKKLLKYDFKDADGHDYAKKKKLGVGFRYLGVILGNVFRFIFGAITFLCTFGTLLLLVAIIYSLLHLDTPASSYTIAASVFVLSYLTFYFNNCFGFGLLRLGICGGLSALVYSTLGTYYPSVMLWILLIADVLFIIFLGVGWSLRGHH